MSEQFTTPAGFIGLIDAMRQIVVASGKSVVAGEPLRLSGHGSAPHLKELADPYWLMVGTQEVLPAALRAGVLTAFTAGGKVQISPRYWVSDIGNKSLMTGCCHDPDHAGDRVLLPVEQFTEWLRKQSPANVVPLMGPGPSDEPPHVAQNRGPRPVVLERITADMLAWLSDGRTTPDKLKDEKQETLAAMFGAKRGSAVKARDRALSLFEAKQNSDKQRPPTNSDKPAGH